MEVTENLKELNMTVEEIDKLREAFKDEAFREMLCDYAEETSDPENKKRYEEEVKLLEQMRGHSMEFIHPEPFRALRTSVNGKQKCFINICTNVKIGKHECNFGVSGDGRTGHCWSLPHSLHPARRDTDPKGKRIIIYDVVFHPDTLHVASKNQRLMDVVDSTAIHGIQDAFKVTLDKNNVRQLNTKYKGTPQPCVIRKSIPGYKAKQPSEEPTTSPQTKPRSFQLQPQESKEPAKPNCTVKCRSPVDLQDFRCSRDSTRSPRHKEMVVTIDVPLLKSVAGRGLGVEEKSRLPLASPVDGGTSEAEFTKQRGQLMVTLPLDLSTGSTSTVGDAREEGKWKEQEREEQRGGGEVDEVKQDRGDEVEDLKEGGEDKDGEEQVRKGREGAEGEERGVGEEEKMERKHK